MANKRIKDLPLHQPTSQSWMAAEVDTGGDYTTSKAMVSSFFSMIQDPLWSSSASTVQLLSSLWSGVYSQYIIQDRSGLVSASTTTREYSGFWTGMYVTVSTNQSKWSNAALSAIELLTIVQPGSADWNANFTLTSTNSANWNAAYDAVNTSYRSASSEWNSVYSYIYSDSACGVGNLIPGFARRYAVDVGNGSDDVFVIPHNFNNRYVLTQVFRNDTGLVVTPASITNTNNNTVTVTFGVPPAGQEYCVVVIG